MRTPGHDRRISRHPAAFAAALVVLLPVLSCVLAIVPVRAAQRSPAHDLESVLRVAGEYVRSYGERLAPVVGEERYTQHRIEQGWPTRSRTTVANFALLRVVGGSGQGEWIGYREVIEVDGEPVQSGESRMRRLLTTPGGAASLDRLAIGKENARFSLSGSRRPMFSAPTVALEFLHPLRQERSRFRRQRIIRWEGEELWVVEFRERKRPTLIRTADGKPLFSHGQFTIRPGTGEVLGSILRVDPDDPVTYVVTYQRNEHLGLLVPHEMHERYRDGTSRIDGLAVYSNFRRFETDAKIIGAR